MPSQRLADGSSILLLRTHREVEEALASAIVAIRREVESLMGAEARDLDQWFLFGRCEACQNPTAFSVDWENAVYSGGDVPLFRERLICVRCGLNTRQRFVFGQIRQSVESLGANAAVYCTEQVTAFYALLRQALTPSVSLHGSEYFGPERASGEFINGIRHEDVEALSFPNATLDLVISNDVFEHVFDVERALAEIRRVLRPGGKLLFTVPLFGTGATRRRAEKTTNGLVHLAPPAYHGDPVGDGRCLVVYDFGWDILEICRHVGFKDAYALGYYSFFYGYLGDGLQFALVAEA